VPAPIGGRGIAAELTRAALETAEAAGWTVVPVCSYAAAYMRRHAGGAA
jgi:predicted GNAT family acetyltransferase